MQGIEVAKKQKWPPHKHLSKHLSLQLLDSDALIDCMLIKGKAVEECERRGEKKQEVDNESRIHRRTHT